MQLPVVTGGLAADAFGSVYFAQQHVVSKWILDASATGGSNVFDITANDPAAQFGPIAVAQPSDSSVAHLLMVDAGATLQLLQDVSTPSGATSLTRTPVTLPGASPLNSPRAMQYTPSNNALYVVNQDGLIKLTFADTTLTAVATHETVFSGSMFRQTHRNTRVRENDD